MLLLAIAILVYPLLKVKNKKAVAYKESNLQLHKQKLKELDNDLEEGRIDQSHYRIARTELDRELLDDVPAESKDTAGLHYAFTAKSQPALALGIAVFLPALALLVYMQLGMHAASEQVAVEPQKPLMSVEAMTAKLEEKLRSRGGEVEEWAMLGRALKHLGQYEKSADAFATALSQGANAQLMLEQAEALALANGQRFDAKGRELVLDALGLQPDNVNALWFAGVAEYQFGNFHESINHLTRLSAVADIDEEINQSIRFYITQAREQLLAAGEEVPTLEELLPATKTAPLQQAAADVVELRVNVDISDEVRKRFSGTDAVFVYAKAVQGPKLPLAVQRKTMADFPAMVVLDDTMAMVEGMNIGAFDSVVVSARVTKSGSAIAQSGDYIGQMVVENVASAGVINIEINELVP